MYMINRILLLFAACFCILATVSCKNQKKGTVQYESLEFIDSTKVVLSVETLSLLDSLCSETVYNLSDSTLLINLNLSEKEKMIKPDFLFNPEDANAYVTRAQKERALAMLFVDMLVRRNYQMPVDHSIKVMKEFMFDLDIPLDDDSLIDSTITIRDRVLSLYSVFQEKGDISHFWRLLFSAQIEAMYISSTSPDLYLRNVDPEFFSLLMSRIQTIADAMAILYKYDSETREIVDAVYDGEVEFKFTSFTTVDQYKNYLISKRPILEKRRAELMKKFPLAGSGLAI